MSVQDVIYCDNKRNEERRVGVVVAFEQESVGKGNERATDRAYRLSVAVDSEVKAQNIAFDADFVLIAFNYEVGFKRKLLSYFTDFLSACVANERAVHKEIPIFVADAVENLARSVAYFLLFAHRKNLAFDDINGIARLVGDLGASAHRHKLVFDQKFHSYISLAYHIYYGQNDCNGKSYPQSYFDKQHDFAPLFRDLVNAVNIVFDRKIAVAVYLERGSAVA